MSAPTSGAHSRVITFQTQEHLMDFLNVDFLRAEVDYRTERARRSFHLFERSVRRHQR